MATIFTCTDPEGRKQTFEGFRKPYIRTDAHPQVLAIVTIECEAEIWALDHDQPDTWMHACHELERYYRMDGHTNIRIAVFDRRLILESE